MRNIKVVALDIYGTVLAIDDPDNTLPPRQGIGKFFDKCDERGIKVAGDSDCYAPNIRADLESCFRKHPESGMSLDRFFEFFCLDELPVKDFSRVARSLGIKPREILVIGDSYKDIGGAIKYGCLYLQCPEYSVKGEREFDFAKVTLDFE